MDQDNKRDYAYLYKSGAGRQAVYGQKRHHNPFESNTGQAHGLPLQLRPVIHLPFTFKPTKGSIQGLHKLEIFIH